MKSTLVLLALVASPSLAGAQTAPTIAPADVAPAVVIQAVPDAKELFDNMFAPYAVAKTFRGNIDIRIEGDDPTSVLNTISSFQLQTIYRFSDRGDLVGQNTTLRIVGKGRSAEAQTLRFADDGRSANIVFVDQKSWSDAGQPATEPISTSLLKPILNVVIQAVDKTPGAVLVASNSVEAGRPVWVVTVQNSDALRVVVDAETRALRSLDIIGPDQKMSIRGSQQVFNEPIADGEFAWKAPVGFKRVPLGKVALPASLNITMPGINARRK